MKNKLYVIYYVGKLFDSTVHEIDHITDDWEHVKSFLKSNSDYAVKIFEKKDDIWEEENGEI